MWCFFSECFAGFADGAEIALEFFELRLLAGFDVAGGFEGFEVVDLSLNAVRVAACELLVAAGLLFTFGLLERFGLFGFALLLRWVDAALFIFGHGGCAARLGGVKAVGKWQLMRRSS